MERTQDLFWNERWRLASLHRSDLVKIGLASGMVGLIYVLFHLQGNTADAAAFGRSVISWMVFRWGDSSISFGSADYSHGWLIPLVSLYVIWYRRDDLFKADKYISKLGLACLVLALLLHWLGAKSQHPRLSLFALIGVIWSIPFYLYGWKVAKILTFPAVFLVFCVPLNFLDDLTFPLRILMTICSTSVLNGLGIAAERSGSRIFSAAGGGYDSAPGDGFNFDVADPCSGLRSLMAMTALTAVYAYLVMPTLSKKWILFLCCIPLAIAGNIARITTVALVAETLGQDVATGLYHDYSGYVVFAVAIGLMVAVGGLLSTNFKEVLGKWKNAFSGPISSSSS
jgi:exosortase